MNVLLDDPTAVLVGGRPADDGRLREALSASDATSVAVADTVDDVERALSDRDDVGCVVATSALSDGEPADLAAAVAESAPDVPVVVWADPGDVGEVCRTVNAGAAGYVPPAAPPRILREQVDEALAEAGRRLVQAERSDAFAAIMGESRVPIYVKDAEGRHLAMSEIPTGMTPENVLGKTDLEVYDDDPEFARQAYEDDMRLIEEQQAVFEKDEEYYNDGDRHWARTNKFPWYDDDGSLKGLIGVSFTITDLKRKERRLETMRDQFDKFANYLSHDLQTPLQVASGALELARETGDPEAFETLDNALERLEEMIDDLGAIVREQRPLGGGITETRIGNLVADVWELVETESADLEVAFPDDAHVNAARQTLRPLLENLFKNAVEHGGEDVTVRVGPTDWDGFYVEDDGKGIPADERDAVLEPGYTTAEDGDGTGLEIVSEIVDQNDWDVAVTESDAGGARFEITSCLVVPDPPAEPATGEELSLDRAASVGNLAVADVDRDAETGRWHVVADGEDVWGEHNDFHFAHERVDGPVRLEAGVEGVSHVNPYSKAALMVRDSLDEDATYGAIGATPGHGTELLWRGVHGEDATSIQLEEDEDQFDRYRVEYRDGTVTPSISREGEEWNAIDQRTFAIEAPVYVGLVACSGVPGQGATATFADVDLRRLD